MFDVRPTAVRSASWIVAVASLGLAAATWLHDVPAPPTPATGSGDRASERAELRASLALSRAQNEALRRELDRLFTRSQAVAARVGNLGNATSAEGSDAPPPTPVALNEELARRAKENVLRGVAGNEQHWEEALDSLIDLVNEGGTNVFPALREIYEATEDQRARQTILPMMLFTGGGEEALGFIGSEMMTTSDADLKRDMLAAVAKVINPSAAGMFKAPFLSALDGDDPRNRIAAVYGLRHVYEPDVTEALFRAASDDSEIVRRLAIEYLVARNADREQVRRLIVHDPSERLRRIGQCHLVIAGDE